MGWKEREDWLGGIDKILKEKVMKSIKFTAEATCEEMYECGGSNNILKG